MQLYYGVFNMGELTMKFKFGIGFIGCAILIFSLLCWYLGYIIPKQKQEQNLNKIVNTLYEEIFGVDSHVEDLCKHQLIKADTLYTMSEIIASGYICKCVTETNKLDFMTGLVNLIQSGQNLDSKAISNLKNMPSDVIASFIDISIILCSAEYEDLGRGYFMEKYGVIK